MAFCFRRCSADGQRRHASHSSSLAGVKDEFVTPLPKELVPLAKLSPDDPTTIAVFECCLNGQEISPGYTEQNDPIAQRTAVEHPAGGIGIGIDRLCLMLLGQESIRDVILFPQLKPK